MHLQSTLIKFPEINLRTRDAHKLRGYFGNLFREKSELLHNHFADGLAKYAYPLVQYKVVGNIPHLLGINEGAVLLTDLFLKIKEIQIEEQIFPVLSKNITTTQTEIGSFESLHEYRFETLWMALNQENHAKYLALHNPQDKKDFLNRQLQNNILSFYKGIGFIAENRILATGKLQEKSTKFKDQSMIAFAGSFVTNAVLPNFAGIGKSVSRGFGTIVRSYE